MKKNIILLAMLAMVSCNQTNTDTTPPPPPAEKTVIVRDSIAPDGTKIKVTDQGISIENKDGNKTNSVNISRDSAGIEISDPK